jgi:uncharacterized protein
MEIHLDRIGEEPFEWSERFSIPPEELEETDLVNLGEVACRGRIERTSASNFLLTYDLDYHQTLACGRCLREIEQAVKTEGQLLLVLAKGAGQGKNAGRKERPAEKAGPKALTKDEEEEMELGEEDLGVLELSEPTFQSRPVVVEQLHLGIPMKPLCRDDCKGLCGSCGADLNEGPCSCPPAVDPRWSRLTAVPDASK